MYGIFGGNVGPGTIEQLVNGVPEYVSVSCNKNLIPECNDVKSARGTTFLAMTLMLIFSAYNNRDAYEPVWRNFISRPFNKVMFVTSWIVFISVLIFIYVPGLNKVVFHHYIVTSGWGTAIAAFLVYAIGCTFWKYLKRTVFFKDLYIKAQTRTSEETSIKE